MLHLREENEKLAARLNEASSKVDISSEMVELSTTSLRHSAEYRRGRDEEVAKLREELIEREHLASKRWPGSRES